MKSVIIPTWTRRRIIIVISVAFIYGVWFNFLDSAAYCPNQKKDSCDEQCKAISIGQIFGGDHRYQIWNTVGHCIPGLFLLWWAPKKFELFIVSVLISSAIMDSPLWGVMRLAQNLPLWHISEAGENFSNTCNLIEWIAYYYNPIGLYPVWNTPSGLPTAALLFWSIIIRIIGATLLIWFQARQEPEKDFYLIDLFIRNFKRH